MGTFPEEHFTHFTRDLQKLAIGAFWASGRQLSAWLVVGNAGALAILFNASLEEAWCERGLLVTITRWFAAGLVAAFASAVVGYLGGFIAARFLGELGSAAENLYSSQFYVREAEAQNYPADAHEADYDRAGKQVGVLQRRLWRLWVAPAVAGILFIISAACFVVGLTLPIMRGEAILAKCDAIQQLTPSPQSPTPPLLSRERPESLHATPGAEGATAPETLRQKDRAG